MSILELLVLRLTFLKECQTLNMILNIKLGSKFADEPIWNHIKDKVHRNVGTEVQIRIGVIGATYKTVSFEGSFLFPLENWNQHKLWEIVFMT